MTTHEEIVATSLPQQAADIDSAAAWMTFRARAIAATEASPWARGSRGHSVLIAASTDMKMFADVISVLGGLVLGTRLDVRSELRPTTEEAVEAAAMEAVSVDIVVLFSGAHGSPPEFWTSVPSSLARARERVRSAWPEAMIVTVGATPPVHEVDLEVGTSLRAARRAVEEANAAVARAVEAEPGAEFVDSSVLAARLGADRWRDSKLAALGISDISLDGLVSVAREVIRSIGALLGLSRRVIATDLDDTFWGGVLGEVGPEGIVAGRHARAAPFTAYQRFLATAREAGIQVVVVSKNELSAVEQAFRERGDLAFGFDDFAAVSCGWEPKSEQLASLAETMHLPLEHFVFIDDNPFECAEVARRLPAVDVVRFEPAVEGVWPRLTSRPTLPPMSAAKDVESGARGASYRALVQAERDANAHASRDDFLASIGMRVTFEPIDDTNFDRAHALVQKTNQMNLTLRRTSPSALRSRLGEPGVIGITMFCRDRYANHGQTGVGVVRIQDGDASIEWFCMSCRVLGRSIERLMLRRLVTIAHAHGARRVTVDVVRGPQNNIANRMLDECGFLTAPTGRDVAEGVTRRLAPETWPVETIPDWLKEGECAYDQI